MAARYWVTTGTTGGTGNWSDTQNWSATSGGTAGASAPGSSDTAIFNASSGSGTATVNSNVTIQTLTCTGFTGTLAFGTNTISLNSTGTIFTGATTMTVTGTPLIICTNNSSSNRTVNPTAVTEANSISFRFTAGTGTLLFGAGAIRDIDFTDGVNPTGWAGPLSTFVVTIYGSLKASTGMSVNASANLITFAATSGTKTINTAGVTFDRPFTFNGVGGTWQLQAALTSGATRACTLTNGTLDLNGYTATFGSVSSSNTNVRTFAFGATGKFVLLNTNVTVWTTSNSTNLTVTGTNPLIQLTTNATTGVRGIIFGAAGEANSISVDVTAGSDQINLSTTNGAYRNVDFTGFTGAVSLQNSILVFGDWNFGGATSLGSGTGTVGFAATSGTKTITSNGLAFPGNVNFSGVGGAWSLQDAFAINSGSTITFTNGSIITNGYAVTAGVFSSSNANTRSLNLGASVVTLTGTGTAWNITDPTNMTFTAGTSAITTTSNTGTITFNGGGLTYYDITFNASPYNLQCSGANTFRNFTITPPASTGLRAMTFLDDQTITGTFTFSGATTTRRVRLSGNTSPKNLTVTTLATLANADFVNITAAGASSPWSGTSLGDLGGNTNITFSAPKTVYWNQPAGGNWSDVAWAATSGGAVNASNFPLSQDTAIFDNTGVGASSTIVFDIGWTLPAISAGSLTNALTFNWNTLNSVATVASGGITFSSAITLTLTQGSLSITPLSNASYTTAGVSFPMNVLFNSNGKTMTLVDNFTCTAQVSHLAGTIVLSNNTLTCDSFATIFFDGTLSSAIAFGTGQINVTGNNKTVWNCANLSTFSYTGTPTVNLTYAGSTGTRTISNGNTAGGTESNAVDFNIVAGGDVVGFSGATAVARNFTVQAAFTGQTGLLGAGYIYGNLLLSPSQTVTSGATATTFAATSGTKTITTNGVTIDRPLTFDGVGGTWSLQDALTMGATRTLTLTNGTLNSGGYTVTTGNFALGSGTKTLTMGASTWSIAGNWDVAANGTGLTLNSGTSTISMTSASAKSFSGNSETYYNLSQDGLGALSISGSNTFIAIANTVQPTTLSFTAGTTQTVNNFNVSGTSGNLVTLASVTPGSQWSLAKNTGGKVLVSYCSISDSNASPAGYWFAPTSQGNVDGGNNTGWNFAATGASNGFFLLL